MKTEKSWWSEDRKWCEERKDYALGDSLWVDVFWAARCLSLAHHLADQDDPNKKPLGKMSKKAWRLVKAFIVSEIERA